MNIGDVLKESAKALEHAGFVHGAKETEIIMTAVIGRDSAWLIAHLGDSLDESSISTIRQAVQQRLNGRPLAYILGWQDFLGLRLKTDRRVLIPRSETEQLVELVVRQVKTFGHTEGHYLEIGTGSGAIAIALKKIFPLAKITATDVSADALEIARENAKTHQLEIKFLRSDLFKNVPRKKFDLVIANLPYVPSEKLAFVSDEVLNWEPTGAIDGGRHGLKYIRPFIFQATAYLGQKSLMALEMWHTHGNSVKQLARRLLPHHEMRIERDLAGFERFALVLPLAGIAKD